ncbi:hypothetical protein HJG60_012079 [Phyllostomus discolor]|uniref:Uncharacterized protein n=1 Tax=Phyllostomus discolor TaxID=89673 RepID=A0A834DYQ7_9CHIR|nr:hypothetical protein HJG60_012079 [Phyllostomus discolor]
MQQHECDGCTVQWAGALPSTLAGRTSVHAVPLPASQHPHGQFPHPHYCSHGTWGFCGYSLNFTFPVLSQFILQAYLTCLFLSCLPQQSISFWGQEVWFSPLAFCLEIMPDTVDVRVWLMKDGDKACDPHTLIAESVP